jgi:uncharacterized protein
VAALSVYLDASVLVSLFVRDAHTQQADRVLRTRVDVLALSDFAAAEFASGIAQHVRARAIAAKDARTIFSDFDEWAARETARVELASADVAAAAVLLRKLDSPLRAPDAIHVAVAVRIGAQLMTFDKAMSTAARRYGVEVVGP